MCIKSRWWLYLFLSTASLIRAEAQNPQPHFRNLNTEHGLPSPEVHEIFEDTKGYIWFGTDNGVARYDGYEFKTFSGAPGLTSPVVLKILQDDQERIWFGTITGEVFIYDEGQMVAYEYNSVLEKYRDRFTDAILADVHDGLAYFMLESTGLLRIDSTGRHILEDFADDTRIGVWNLPNTTLAINNESSPNSEGIYHIIYKRANGKEIKIPEPYDVRCNLATTLMNGSTYILRFGNCYEISPNAELKKFRFPHTVSTVREIDGSIWMSHFSKPPGLKRYTSSFPEAKEPDITLLAEHPITDFKRASDGGLWVSSLNNGVFYAGNPSTIFYNQESGLPADKVTCIDFIDSVRLVLGFTSGQICILNTETNHVQDLHRPIRKNLEEHIYYVAYAESHDLIFSGKWVYDEGAWIKVHGSFTKKAEFSEDKNLIYGTSSAAFSILDLTKQERVFVPAKKLPRFRTHAIKEIEGELWIGNSKGIFKYTNDTLEHPKIPHPAFHSRVEDIDEIAGKGIVFGTKGHGVVIWLQDKIHQITEVMGLPSDMIEDVHVDEDGIVWVATLNGLGEIRFDEDTITKVATYTIDEGLPSNEIYQIKSRAKQPWLCTAGGLVKWVSPKESTKTSEPFITKISINGNAVAISDMFKLSHTQSDLTFHYIAINIKQNGKIPYRYRMHKDAEWTHTQNRSIDFSNLAPDEYTFEVQAQNRDGYWSPSHKLPIHIRPAWYRSNVALLVWIILFGLLAYILYRRRVQAMERESRTDKKILGLQQSALQAQMNPHFIFNCLSSIQSLINQDDKEGANMYMGKFAKLARECLVASSSNVVPLSQDISLLRNYLDLEKLRFKDGFTYELEIDPEIEIDLCNVAPMLVQPFVENAIVHGFRNLGNQQGHIVISYTLQDEDTMEVNIRDNGIGYSVGKLGSNRDSTHKSFGMSITKQRLQILGAEDGPNVKIQDIKKATGETCGTHVCIRILLT